MRIYIEVDNTVTLTDNLNFINGSYGSGNTLSLESVFDQPVEQDTTVDMEIKVVTTTTTKIVIYVSGEVR